MVFFKMLWEGEGYGLFEVSFFSIFTEHNLLTTMYMLFGVLFFYVNAGFIVGLSVE